MEFFAKIEDNGHIQYFTQFGHVAELSESELVMQKKNIQKTPFRLRVGKFLQNKFGFT
jgi:hypothetical protein